MIETDFTKFLHVAAASAWVGGSLMLHALYVLASGAKDAAKITALIDWSETLGKVYYGPVSLLTLLAGVATTVFMGYEFSEPIVSIGFLGVFVSMGISGALITPRARRWKAALADGADSAGAQTAGTQTLRLAALNLIILFAVVYAMVALSA